MADERLEGSLQARREQRRTDFEEYRAGKRTRTREGSDSSDSAPRASAEPSAPASTEPTPSLSPAGETGASATALPSAPVSTGAEHAAPASTADVAPRSLPPPPSAMAAPTPAAAASATPGTTPAIASGGKGSEAAAPIAPVARVRGGVATPAPAASPTTSPPPDTRHVEQAAEVLRQLRAQLHPGQQRVLVNLSPPELGRIAIDMSLKRGRLHAAVRVENPQTLELLERQAPELRALLAQGGMEAESFELELGFENAFTEGRKAEARLPFPAPSSNAIESPSTEDAGPALPTPVGREGGIDTYA